MAVGRDWKVWVRQDGDGDAAWIRVEAGAEFAPPAGEPGDGWVQDRRTRWEDRHAVHVDADGDLVGEKPAEVFAIMDRRTTWEVAECSRDDDAGRSTGRTELEGTWVRLDLEQVLEPEVLVMDLGPFRAIAWANWLEDQASRIRKAAGRR